MQICLLVSQNFLAIYARNRRRLLSRLMRSRQRMWHAFFYLPYHCPLCFLLLHLATVSSHIHYTNSPSTVLSSFSPENWPNMLRVKAARLSVPSTTTLSRACVKAPFFDHHTPSTHFRYDDNAQASRTWWDTMNGYHSTRNDDNDDWTKRKLSSIAFY